MPLWSWWSTTEPQQAQQPQLPSQTSAQHQPAPTQSVSTYPNDAPIQPQTQPKPTPRPAASISQKAKADALDRDEAAYEELRALFRAAADPTTSSSTTSPTLDADTTANNDDADDSLYPSRLSCSQCFDAAYYCSSIGGQLNNVYRYGGLRSCTDLWAQWRFCMRTKTMSEAERRRRIREWNREKEGRRRVSRNSEEIWDLRKLGEGQEDAVPAFFAGAAADGQEMGATSDTIEGQRRELLQGDDNARQDGALGPKVNWGWR